MRGRRLVKTGGVFAGIRGGFFRAENDADVSRSFAAVEWYYSDRLLDRRIQRASGVRSAAGLGKQLGTRVWVRDGPELVVQFVFFVGR